jgi:hypothetical protein
MFLWRLQQLHRQQRGLHNSDLPKPCYLSLGMISYTLSALLTAIYICMDTKISLVATICCLKKKSKKSNPYSADRFIFIQPVYLRRLHDFLYSFTATISSPVACHLTVKTSTEY